MTKVTSSFKLQESALGSNASEAERNALAQKKIGAQSEIVSKQISNLEQQLEITKKELDSCTARTRAFPFAYRGDDRRLARDKGFYGRAYFHSTL